LAFVQAIGRVYDRILDQGCEALLMAIVERPDSMQKVQRLQALEILNRRVEQSAEEHNLPDMAKDARVWSTLFRLTAKAVWSNLGTGAAMPSPNEMVVVIAFMADGELMGVLGFQPDWDADLKGVDPDLDLKATDLDEGLS